MIIEDGEQALNRETANDAKEDDDNGAFEH